MNKNLLIQAHLDIGQAMRDCNPRMLPFMNEEQRARDVRFSIGAMENAKAKIKKAFKL